MKKINIKFKNNFFVSLGKAYSPFNSQNTIWFKEIFPLLYLPVSCSMRATDIIRGLVAIEYYKMIIKSFILWHYCFSKKK